MRWYGIDDLSAEDTARLAQVLKDMELSSGIDGLYWLPVPEARLSPVQREHQADCGPYVPVSYTHLTLPTNSRV